MHVVVQLAACDTPALGPTCVSATCKQRALLTALPQRHSFDQLCPDSWHQGRKMWYATNLVHNASRATTLIS